MNIRTTAAAMLMPRRALLALDGGGPIRIDVTAGTVWITRDGDRNDYLLGPDQSITLESDERTLIQAETASTVALSTEETPAPEGWRARLKRAAKETYASIIAAREAGARRDFERWQRRGLWL